MILTLNTNTLAAAMTYLGGERPTTCPVRYEKGKVMATNGFSLLIWDVGENPDESFTLNFHKDQIKPIRAALLKTRKGLTFGTYNTETYTLEHNGVIYRLAEPVEFPPACKIIPDIKNLSPVVPYFSLEGMAIHMAFAKARDNRRINPVSLFTQHDKEAVMILVFEGIEDCIVITMPCRSNGEQEAMNTIERVLNPFKNPVNNEVGEETALDVTPDTTKEAEAIAV